VNARSDYRGRGLLLVLTVALVVVYAAIGFIQARQHDILIRAAADSERGLFRGVARLEMECQLLINALYQRVWEPQSKPLEQLQLQYETFAGHLISLETGNEQFSRTPLPQVAIVRSDFQAFLSKGDLVLGPDVTTEPTREQLQLVIKELTALTAVVHDLTLWTWESSGLAVDARNAEVTAQANITSALTVFQGLLTFALGFAVLRQYRQREWAKADAQAQRLKLVEADAELEKQGLRRAAQEELKEITHALPLVVYRLRRTLTGEESYRYVSDRLEELTGIVPADLLRDASLMHSIVHPEDQEAVAQQSNQALSELKRYSQEFRIQKANGETHWVYCESVPRQLDDGSVLSTGYIQLIDATKERALRLNEITAQQHAIFENTPVGLLFSIDGKIHQFNAKFASMMGLSNTELLGKGLDFFFDSPSDLKEISRQASTLFQVGERVEFEHEIQPLGGAPFFARVVGRRFVGTAHGTQAIWVMEDISDQKLAQSQMRRAKEMAEETNRLKGDFLANMSHEIRTPMNAIIMLSHLALRTDLTARQRDYLSKIQYSGQHLLGIINDILDFSKVEAGKLDVEAVPFELDRVLENVANVTADKATAKGLELVCDMAPGVLSDLVGDPLRIGQVLINYVTNAIKFTEKGEVSVIVSTDRLGPTEVLLRFEVRDTGIGLNEAQVSRLFKSFQQGDASTTRRYGGSGLGLAISKALAEAMGGSVGVDSVPGKGSTFWFTARVAVGEAREPQHLPNLDLRGRRVLVVDDNEHAAHVLVDMLEALGFHAQAADSGVAALSMVAESDVNGTPFDLIMLDWLMPGMDGLEVARRMGSMGLAVLPRCIMVTSYGREEVFNDVKSTLVEAVLTKPVSASALFNTMLSVMGADVAATRRANGAGKVDAKLQIVPLAGARILLAEDNDLNQQVAVELLEDAGFVVDVAENGRIACDRVQFAADQGHPYDLVLMDMQMPVMDGVAATIEIRKAFSFDVLPIVAMTANALKADRAKCSSAGMNDFVPKPVNPDELWVILSRRIKPRAGLGQVPQRTHMAVARVGDTPDSLAVVFERLKFLDLGQALARVGGKKSVFLGMLQQFVANYRGVGEQLGALVASGDHRSAARVAHTLKGVAGNVGADGLHALAGQLEMSLENVPVHNEVLVSCLVQCRTELDRLMLELIEVIPAVSAVESGGTIDAKSIAPAIRRLRDLLSEDDPAAGEFLQSQIGVLQSALGEDFASIDAAIRGYDFSLALKALRDAIARKGYVLTG
jgi:PAS domain S-box-containing protein